MTVALPPGLAGAVHAFFEVTAMAFGARYFWALNRRPTAFPAGWGRLLLLAALLIGAGLANKAAYWLEFPQNWLTGFGWIDFLLGGQSIVGGLLGGLLGVELAKAALGHRGSTGDAFVFPLLLGIAWGRIGCFLAGLQDQTYGVASSLPWAVDFGDGVLRHPTQLYEIAFCAAAGAVLYRLAPRLAARPGALFKLFLSAYLAWRLGIDFLKPVPYAYVFGLSGIQLLCLIALALYLPWCARALRTIPPGTHVLEEAR